MLHGPAVWPVRFSTSPRVGLTFLVSCGTVSGQNSLVTPHGHAPVPQPPARCCVCPRMGPRAPVQRPDLYPGAGASVMRPAGQLVRSARMRLGQRGESRVRGNAVSFSGAAALLPRVPNTPQSHTRCSPVLRSAGFHPHPLGFFRVHRDCD